MGRCAASSTQDWVQGKQVGGRRKGPQVEEYDSSTEKLHEGIFASLKIYLGIKKGCRK